MRVLTREIVNVALYCWITECNYDIPSSLIPLWIDFPANYFMPLQSVILDLLEGFEKLENDDDDDDDDIFFENRVQREL